MTESSSEDSRSEREFNFYESDLEAIDSIANKLGSDDEYALRYCIAVCNQLFDLEDNGFNLYANRTGSDIFARVRFDTLTDAIEKFLKGDSNLSSDPLSSD